MCNNQIKELLESLDKLARELRDSNINFIYKPKESHIRTVRKAQETIKKLCLELKDKY